MGKSKGVALDSTPGHGVVFSEDARLKFQILVQNYQKLQKEVAAMRKSLGAANRRKTVAAAEVRFLRRKYQSLVKESTSSKKLSNNSDQMRGSFARSGTEKRKEVCHSSSPMAHPHHKEVLQGRKRGIQLGSNRGNEVGVAMKRKAVKRSEKLVPEYGEGVAIDAHTFGLDSWGRIKGFEMNISLSRTEDMLPNRAPLFDLNEISVGDEDIQYNAEPVKTITSSNGDNLQNELKLLMCRNAGEGSSSRVAKRKISWQDPVAVRV